jgi:hypothetical protein
VRTTASTGEAKQVLRRAAAMAGRSGAPALAAIGFVAMSTATS